VLNTPEVAAKDDKLLSTTQSNTTNAITPSIILTAGHESTPGPGNRDATNSTKSKIINLSQTATVSGTILNINLIQYYRVITFFFH
jgi:hypothetical protein